jgi:phenylacetate-CoA ligase
MTPENMESFYRALGRIQPRYLVGYVGAVDVFARFMERQGYQLPGVKAVWTTSAPLPEVKRRYFEQVFGCKAYTQYGSCEFYWIAAECAEQSGMHIATDARHVEVVNAQNEPVPDGEWGDLIVTDLLNHAFPLIRYRIGDRGRLLTRRCPCGRPYPLMDYVRGRISDIIRVPGGGEVPGEYWTTIFDDFTDAIQSFQVHQQADLSVTIRYEPRPGAEADPVIAAVASRLERSFGPRLNVTFLRDVIELNDNGKMRLVTSDVPR